MEYSEINMPLRTVRRRVNGLEYYCADCHFITADPDVMREYQANQARLHTLGQRCRRWRFLLWWTLRDK